MAKITKADPTSFGDWAYLAVEKHFKKTIKHETDVLKDKDPEALHQMRVGMRRLRTAVTGFAPALDLPKATQEKKIGKIAHRLGQLRDLDVLKDTLQNQYLPALPKQEQDALKKVLSALEKQRHKTLEQVQETLKSEHYQKLKQAFKNWLDQPTYGNFAEFGISDILPDLLLPPISQLLLHPALLIGVELQAGEVTVPNTLNSNLVVKLLNEYADTAHSLRKQAKRVRYQMELFTDFYGSAYQDYVNDIKEIQSFLGEIQDSFVLAEFLTNTLGSESTDKLPTLTAQLIEARYQAWQEWQPLQKKYLDAKIRNGLHRTVLKPISTGKNVNSD